MYYQRYKLRLEKLPNIYKTYATIDSIKDNDYEILEINGAYSEPVLQINDSTIVIINGYSEETEDGSRDVKNAWYKINNGGQITDSLNYKYNNRKQVPLPNLSQLYCRYRRQYLQYLAYRWWYYQ